MNSEEILNRRISTSISDSWWNSPLSCLWRGEEGAQLLRVQLSSAEVKTEPVSWITVCLGEFSVSEELLLQHSDTSCSHRVDEAVSNEWAHDTILSLIRDPTVPQPP
ncbi:hypothetical protein SRHO_G00015270 [Serrasalmus rhombeus]